MESTQAGTPAALRRSNVAHLLRVIREHGPLSRGDLVQLSDLSKPTVRTGVEELLRADLVVESAELPEVSRSRPGPTPRLLRFNASHALVAGLDVGAAKMLAVLSDLDGQTLAVARSATPTNATGRRLDQAVKSLLDKCLAHAAVGRGRLAAASIGTTGVVDRETGTVTFAPQLPGWQGRAVKPALEELLGVPVLLENEAHLAMLGESWRGIATDVGDAVLIQFGVGVGMGILIGGEIYRGAKGAAGEIGYLPIGDTMTTTEGGPGKFETTVGSLAISRHMARAATGTGRRGRGGGENAQRRDVSAAEVFARASEGDRAAQQAIGDVLSYLAAGLAAVSAVLNPELIVLGGGLAASLAPHVERLQAELLRRVPAGPRVELSALGDSAVAVGAVKRAVTFAETGLFDAINLA